MRSGTPLPWRTLAFRAKMRTSARDDRAPDRRAAAKAFLSLALIDSVPQLKLSAATPGIHVVRNGRSPQPDCFGQDVAHRAIQPMNFVPPQRRANPHWMDSRAPQALVRVNVSHAAQHVLIEQQRLNPRSPRVQRRGELTFRRLQRIEAERSQRLFSLAIH